MKVGIEEGDLTRRSAAALVNAANSSLLRGGVDGAIRRPADPRPWTPAGRSGRGRSSTACRHALDGDRTAVDEPILVLRGRALHELAEEIAGS